VAVVPKALVRRGKAPSLKDVLGSLPLAAQTADGQFTQRLRKIASDLKVEIEPALACQSFPQTLSAVRGGGFAAILPTLALQDLSSSSYVLIKAEPLKQLTRKLVLVWSRRTTHVRPTATPLAQRLVKALKVE
jgi:DNA-binding transcriptional LysR family regulator